MGRREEIHDAGIDRSRERQSNRQAARRGSLSEPALPAGYRDGRQALTPRLGTRSDALTDLFILRGIPAWIRSDNGPEFVAEAVRGWIAAVGARTAFIEPGSPWENGYIESFNARLRDELLNGEIFYTLKEAQVLIESWRRHYNAIRPHSSLGYRPPAPETIVTPGWPPGSATLRRPSSLAEKPSMH